MDLIRNINICINKAWAKQFSELSVGISQLILNQ